MTDEECGRRLAELARQFLLWLRDNELPGIRGLRDTEIGQFELYAGTYHAKRSSGLVYDLPNLWLSDPAEVRRLRSLRLGVSHLLLLTNEHDIVTLTDGRKFHRNRIVEVGNVPLERPGALMTVSPVLDSRTADDKTLSTVRRFDICSISQRIDLVWDDAEAAAQAHFKYPFILAYETPRLAYEVNVQKVLPPQQILPDPNSNAYDRILVQRARAFRETLYFTATYANRRRVADRGGDYYAKWRADKPTARDRQFRPTLLTDTYLKECFTEFVMKKGDDVLMVELPEARAFYRLIQKPPSRQKPYGPSLSVEPLLTISTRLAPPTGAELAKRAGRAAPDDDTPIAYPVPAVLFHAVDGGENLPTVLRRGKLDYSGGPPTRVVVDYKAYVRWLHNDSNLNLGSDDAWLESFRDAFFGDAAYPLDLTGTTIEAHTHDIFLSSLRAEAGESVGPIKERLNQLIEWCEQPNHVVFTQGMRFGPDGNHRELVGITSRDVYEWHPATGVVTSIRLRAFFEDLRISQISAEVYRGTAGMVAFITLVTWGGVIVMTGGVLGMGATLSGVARETVRQLGQQFAGKMIAKQAARTAAPFLVAMLAENIAPLIFTAREDEPTYEVFRRFVLGFFHGFGMGAVDHYLTEVDKRLERAAKLVPEVAANVATKGGYRAYLIYRKVSAAVSKITILVKTLRLVLTDERARKLAELFSEFCRLAGTGFLIILFVVVYINFYVSYEQNELDAWVDRQRRALQHMVKETGEEISRYVDGVRAEIDQLRKSGQEPTPAVLHKHDETLRQLIAEKARAGASDVAAVGDFLVLLLREMGIKDTDELRRLGLTELMARGWDAFPKEALLPDVAQKLGEALGEFIGTIMLERRIVPQKVRNAPAPTFYNRSPSKVAKTALTGGVWRALWRFVTFPFQDIGTLPESLKRALESPSGQAKRPAFSKAERRDSAYQALLRDLVGDEDELARRIMRLAENADLKAHIDTVVANAIAGTDPPHLGELLKEENPDWPGDAVFFILFTWLRIGLHHLMEMFELIENDSHFDGKFRIRELLDVIGLDIALDDKSLAAVKVAFSHVK